MEELFLIIAFMILMKRQLQLSYIDFHYLIIIFFETQKQPPEVFYKRSCS